MSTRWREGGAWPLAGFALVHLLIFTVLFRTVYTIPFSGTGLYFDYASKLLAGQIPYRDFQLEYPPLALAFFALPRLAGPTFAQYYIGWQTQIVVWDLIVLVTLWSIARRGGNTGNAPSTVLAAYTLFVLALGPIVAEQYDLFPAALTLIAIWCFQGKRRAGGWVALTLGAMTKLYPLLLIPVFALPMLERRERRERRDYRALRTMMLVCAATAIVVMLPLLVTAPTAIVHFFAYHANRGIQVESLYASILLVADKWRLLHVGLAFSYGAWNVTGTVPDVLTMLSTPILLATLIACYVWIQWVWRRSSREISDPFVTAPACALVVVGTLVASKVLSPQYLIWLAPLLPLVPHGRRWIWPLFALIGVATYYIFPSNYQQLVVGNDGVVITVLLLRNLSFIALGLLLALSLKPETPVEIAP